MCNSSSEFCVLYFSLNGSKQPHLKMSSSHILPFIISIRAGRHCLKMK